jgi:acetoin:2,6-dichlorophenolindophenol oxidoreductase subunit beta
VARLGGAEVPMPYAKDLERAAIPSVDDIVRQALRLVGKKAPAAV